MSNFEISKTKNILVHSFLEGNACFFGVSQPTIKRTAKKQRLQCPATQPVSKRLEAYNTTNRVRSFDLLPRQHQCFGAKKRLLTFAWKPSLWLSKAFILGTGNIGFRPTTRSSPITCLHQPRKLSEAAFTTHVVPTRVSRIQFLF